MSKKPLILGIESSCDETAASLITENEEGFPVVLSNIVSSQVEVHREFGGVVPELAARSHIEKIDWIVKKAIDESGRKIEEIDAVASTAGPGLIVCLSVGLSFGKAFATAMNKPFIAVNHLEGHALSPKLNTNLNYPYLLLLISGGHSQYLSVQNLGKYKRLGTTIDDALGEAFDKTAKLLGIEFPGGPKIEVFADKGNPERYKLPKPIINRGGCNLSFAGLKTAVLKISKKNFTDALIAEGIPLGWNYGCLVSTWPWAKKFFKKNFNSPNALSTRNTCFHLYLNENYKLKEAIDIVSAIKKIENYYLNEK